MKELWNVRLDFINGRYEIHHNLTQPDAQALSAIVFKNDNCVSCTCSKVQQVKPNKSISELQKRIDSK